MNAKEKSFLCANFILDKKAINLVILDVAERSSFTDYFLICSGTSDRHVQGIANHIEMNFKKMGIVALGLEGFREGKWILMDYGDVIIHIFHEPVREFYNLERLWSESPHVAMDDIKAEMSLETYK